MTVTLSRTSARPGENVVVWTRAGDLDASGWTATGPSGTVELVAAQPSRGPVTYWTSGYVLSLALPSGLKPGLYALANQNRPAGALTVMAPAAPAKWSRLAPTASGDMAAAIEQTFAKRDVELLPGYYQLARPVTIPSGRRLRGYGAVIEAAADGAFKCADDVTLEGLTVQGAGNLFAPGSTLLRLSLRRCRFDGLSSGFGPGLTATDCEWDRCGVLLNSEQLLLRPRFLNTFAGNATLIRGSGAAIIDGVWRDTDRGPIAQTHERDVTDCLILHADISGLTHVSNGGEVVAAEGGGRFDRNLVLHLRATNCDGPVFQIMGPGARDNLVREFQADGGGGVVLDSQTNPIENTTFQAGELRSVSGITLGPNTSGTRFAAPDPWGSDRPFEPCRLINPRPTRGSQYQQTAPALSDWRPVRDLGRDNGAPEVVEALPVVKPAALRFSGP